MKKVLKIFLYILLSVAILISCGLAFLFIRFPKTGKPPAIQAQTTPEVLQRGEYLVHHVVGCLHCHSERDGEKWGEPMKAGTEGKGSLFLTVDSSKIYAPNITPYRLKNWTDGEIARAILSGVNKDGDPLFPMMPYPEYSHLSERDMIAIVSYIRTLKPIVNDVPRTSLEFPLNLIVRAIPTPAEPKAEPSREEYGKYLATLANCISCHTPIDRGQPIEGQLCAGGRDFDRVYSANITPDPETGIGNWTKEDFVQAFKRFDMPEARDIHVNPNINTVMPWGVFAGMREDDLAAICEPLNLSGTKFSVSRARKPDPREMFE